MKPPAVNQDPRIATLQTPSPQKTSKAPLLSRPCHHWAPNSYLVVATKTRQSDSLPPKRKKTSGMENLKKMPRKASGFAPTDPKSLCQDTVESNSSGVRVPWGGWKKPLLEANKPLQKQKKKSTENQSLTEQNLYIHNFTSPKRKPQPSDIPPVHVARWCPATSLCISKPWCSLASSGQPPEHPRYRGQWAAPGGERHP